MSTIKYKVNLSDDEKIQLEALLSKGKSAARSQTRARILFKAQRGGLQDKDIIETLDVSPSMVAKTRQRFVEEGIEVALKDHPRPGKTAKLTNKQAAHVLPLLVALHRKGMSTGRYGCWQTKWWSHPMHPPPVMKQSASF
jgi:transposase